MLCPVAGLCSGISLLYRTLFPSPYAVHTSQPLLPQYLGCGASLGNSHRFGQSHLANPVLF